MLGLQNLELLSQLINSLEKAVEKLELAYNKKDAEKFNESKKEILDYQKNIEEILK